MSKLVLWGLTDEVKEPCSVIAGYSGSDMKNLVKEASMGPLREALTQGKDISKISNDEMRSISLQVNSRIPGIDIFTAVLQCLVSIVSLGTSKWMCML